MRNHSDRSLAKARRVVLVSASLVLSWSCHDVLKVELPGRIPSNLLSDPTTAPTLAASVVADFECAFSNYVSSTVILSDEFLGASGNSSERMTVELT